VPTLAIGDRRLSYEDHGAGPVALLIHGSPGNGKAWAKVGERLAGRHRVVAPDLPGYGETTPQAPGQPLDVAYACELLEALVRHVGEPAVLAAHSYGGVVALRLALRARVRIGALALFEPVAVNLLAMDGDAAAHAAVRSVFDGYVARVESGEDRAVRTMVDFWFGEGAFAGMPDPLAAYLTREAATNVRDVRATFGEAYSAGAFRDLPMPVVTVVGDRSPPITHRIGRLIAEHVPRGSFRTLAGANHAMTTTHADAMPR